MQRAPAKALPLFAAPNEVPMLPSRPNNACAAMSAPITITAITIRLSSRRGVSPASGDDSSHATDGFARSVIHAYIGARSVILDARRRSDVHIACPRTGARMLRGARLGAADR